jgi:hypothetical protein
MEQQSKFHYGFPSIAYDGSKSHIARQLIDFLPPKGRLFIDLFAGRGNFFWALATLAPDRFERYMLNDFKTGPFFEAIRTHGHKVQPSNFNDLEAIRHECARIKLKLKAHDYDLATISPEERLLEPYLTFGGRGYRSGGSAKRWAPERFQRTILGAQKLLLDLNPRITTSPWDQLLPFLRKLTWDDCIYLDPPYFGCDMNSYDPWSIEEYKQLIDFLKFAPCKWVLSEYRHSMYTKVFGEPRVIPVRCNVGNLPKNRSQREECVWTNWA